MNILMLGHWLAASTRNGVATRDHRFARRLASQHEVTLAFVTDQPDACGPLSALRTDFGDLEFSAIPRGWKRVWSATRFAAGEAGSVAYWSSQALRTRLRDRLRTSRYALVYVSASSLIPYALELDPAVPVVIDFGDVDSERWLRQAGERSLPVAALYRAEASRLRGVEAAAARRAARCVISSPDAARVVGSFAPWAPVTVIPDGLDPDRFTPLLRLPTSPTVVFVSPLERSQDLSAAAEFCRSVVAAVRARIPATRFVVVGTHAPAGTNGLGEIPGVEVAAPVSDVRPFLHRAAVAVAPLGSSYGLQRGMLEAMATGVPVVTTSRGCEGLGGRPGRDYRVEDDPAAFARTLIGLLQSAALRAEVGGQGSAFVRTHYSWDAAAARFAEVVEAVVPAPQRSHYVSAAPSMSSSARVLQ